MKRLNIVLLLLTINFSLVNAQTDLWGYSSYGGIDNSSTIFKMHPDSTNPEIIYSFVPDKGGITANIQLCEPSSGILYGVTSSGSSYDSDLIFSYDILKEKYEVKAYLNTINGSKPLGGLVKASNGKLYGTTSEGGTDGKGILFEYDYINDILTNKQYFHDSLGTKPMGALVEGRDGELYGITSEGATGAYGSLFLYNFKSDTLIKKINFNPSQGSLAMSGLRLGSDGNLYGTTTKEGQNGAGTLFSYNILNSTLNVKVNFPYTEGNNSNKLLEVSNGNFLGIITDGGTDGNGLIYEYNTSNNTYTNKLELQDITHGKAPTSSLVLAPNGKLYGTNSQKESSTYGLIYEANVNLDTLTVKHSFYKDSHTPSGDLFLASNGKIYGFTSNDNNLGTGSLFEFDPVKATVAHKVRFSYSPLGYDFSTNNSLIKGTNGKLYGRTLKHGAYDAGTVFQLDPKKKEAHKLFDIENHLDKEQTESISSTNGSYLSLSGSLIPGKSNNFYTVNHFGGNNQRGVLLEYNYEKDSLAELYHVPLSQNQFYLASLAIAKNDKLYGLNKYNKLLEVSGASSPKELKDLNQTSDLIHYPYPFIQTSNDKLYASSYNGGIRGEGVIYNYDITNDTLKILHEFDGTTLSNLNGSKPTGSLLEVDDSNVMGLAEGGKRDKGIVYNYNTTSDTFTKKIDLDDFNLDSPTGNLVLHPNTKIYGSATSVGASKIFEYNPSSNSISKVLNISSTSFGDVKVLSSICLSNTITPELVSLPDLTDECKVDNIESYRATTNCGDVIIGKPTPTFPITQQGTTIITWLYEDLQKNRITQTQNVILNDITPPSSLNPVLDTLYEDCPLDTLYGLIASDNCVGPVTASSNLNFPLKTLGEHNIIWTYDDGNGNTTTQNQILVLRDTKAPVPDLSSLPDITADNSLPSLNAPTATDACAGVCTGTTTTTFPITQIGETIVTWEYNDGNNGLISQQRQKVIILDKKSAVPIVAKLPDLRSSCSITFLTAPKAQDANKGLITGTHRISLPITKQGLSKILWTYDDGLGNKSTQEQLVNIQDLDGPIPTKLDLADIYSNCIVTNLQAPTAIDQCKGIIISVPNVTLPITAEGKTLITWTYNDGNGNRLSQTQNVYITPIDNSVKQNANILTANGDYETYQWLDCNDGNKPIVGETNKSFIATKAGSYALRINNKNCVAVSKCINVRILSSQTTSRLDDITISPNPSQGIVYIDQRNHSDKLKIKVLNSSGKLILKKKSKTQLTKLDLHQFEKGAYVIIIANGRNTSSHKIIKE